SVRRRAGIQDGGLASLIASCVHGLSAHPGGRTMIRPAALAVAALSFGLSAAVLLAADTSGRAVRRTLAERPPHPNPIGVAVSPDGKRAYVALNGTDELAEVDLESGEVLRRFKTGHHPHEVFRDGSILYVADDEPEYLRIDVANGETDR